jgi:hypothetical protein
MWFLSAPSGSRSALMTERWCLIKSSSSRPECHEEDGRGNEERSFCLSRLKLNVLHKIHLPQAEPAVYLKKLQQFMA